MILNKFLWWFSKLSRLDLFKMKCYPPLIFFLLGVSTCSFKKQISPAPSLLWNILSWHRTVPAGYQLFFTTRNSRYYWLYISDRSKEFNKENFLSIGITNLELWMMRRKVFQKLTVIHWFIGGNYNNNSKNLRRKCLLAGFKFHY